MLVISFVICTALGADVFFSDGVPIKYGGGYMYKEGYMKTFFVTCIISLIAGLLHFFLGSKGTKKPSVMGCLRCGHTSSYNVSRECPKCSGETEDIRYLEWTSKIVKDEGIDYETVR